jgi:hypothetical protein
MIDSEAGRRWGRQAGVDFDILTDYVHGGKQYSEGNQTFFFQCFQAERRGLPHIRLPWPF